LDLFFARWSNIRRFPFRHYRNLVLHKAYADFRAEAQRTYLGVIWWVLEPLINMFIYYLVFGVFLRVGRENFIPYLLIGLVVWRFYDTTVTRAACSILSNMTLVRQTAYHKIIFPLVAICTCSFEFIFSLLLLFAVLLFTGFWPTIYIVLLPALLFVLLLFTIATALPLAVMVPFVPDLMKPVQYGLRLAFYMSAIMYEVSALPHGAQVILRWNPALHIIQAFRDILMYHRLPNYGPVLIITAFSIPVIVFGVWFNSRFDTVYAKRVSS
jgi:lipopolysaccharide transport system permease protein